jgi:hypothetical protein
MTTHALSYKSIEVWSLDVAVTVCGNCVRTLIISKQENNIRAVSSLRPTGTYRK